MTDVINNPSVPQDTSSLIANLEQQRDEWKQTAEGYRADLEKSEALVTVLLDLIAKIDESMNRINGAVIQMDIAINEAYQEKNK